MLPECYSGNPIIRRVEHERPRHQLNVAVVKQIRGLHHHQVSRLVREDPWGKMASAIIFKAHQRDRVLIRPIIETTGSDNIWKSITIEVDDDWTKRSRKIAYPVISELPLPQIFQPLNPMPGARARGSVVKAVAICIYNIGPAIPVYIPNAESTAPVILVGRAIKDPITKVAMTVAHKGMHFL